MNQLGLFVLVILLFGLDLINLCNFVGFFFTDLDAAFKNSVIFMAVLGFAFPIANGILDAVLSTVDKSGTLAKILNWITLLISPFNSITQGIQNVTYDGFI